MEATLLAAVIEGSALLGKYLGRVAKKLRTLNYNLHLPMPPSFIVFVQITRLIFQIREVGMQTLHANPQLTQIVGVAIVYAFEKQDI